MAKTKVVRGFDKDNAGTISTLAREAVEKALAKYGINVSYGGGRFKELEFNLKFKLSKIVDNISSGEDCYLQTLCYLSNYFIRKF